MGLFDSVRDTFKSFEKMIDDLEASCKDMGFDTVEDNTEKTQTVEETLPDGTRRVTKTTVRKIKHTIGSK